MREPELRLSTVCIQTLLLLILFVCQSTCEYFVSMGLFGEWLNEEVWETIRGVKMKRSPSTAESEPLETPLWWNKPTVQYNATVESRKRTKQRKTWTPFWGVISHCFGLTAFSLGTTELYQENLWLKNEVGKAALQNMCVRICVCLFTSSFPHCFSWVSVKGYIDEQDCNLSLTIRSLSITSSPFWRVLYYRLMRNEESKV